MQSKPFWLSKTVIVNALTAAVAFAGTATEMIPEQYQHHIVTAVAVANILLRFISASEVTLTKK